jgi:hypothetical protein
MEAATYRQFTIKTAPKATPPAPHPPNLPLPAFLPTAGEREEHAPGNLLPFSLLSPEGRAEGWERRAGEVRGCARLCPPV